MELLHYAGGDLMTGDAIAHAVLDYAKVLAKNETSDEVEIPIRHEDGSLGSAQLLIGPASQLVAESLDSDLEELVDDALVDDLRVKAARLSGPRPVVDAAALAVGGEFELDDTLPRE